MATKLLARNVTPGHRSNDGRCEVLAVERVAGEVWWVKGNPSPAPFMHHKRAVKITFVERSFAFGEWRTREVASLFHPDHVMSGF